MKKLLIILSFIFCTQSQAQTSNEYLSVCKYQNLPNLYVSTGDDYEVDYTSFERSTATLNNTLILAKIIELEEEGWVLMNIEFSQGDSRITTTCAFMKRTTTTKEEDGVGSSN